MEREAGSEEREEIRAHNGSRSAVLRMAGESDGE